MILMWAAYVHYFGHWKGWALKISIFWAQVALASLVSIWPTPSNGPCNGCSPHQNHYIPHHINNRCINSYLVIATHRTLLTVYYILMKRYSWGCFSPLLRPTSATHKAKTCIFAHRVPTPPPPLHVGTVGKNNLNKEIIPLLPQRTELTIAGPLVSSALSFIAGIHIGARALHVLNLILFGWIARLSQWGGG
jgi:hypothetical protein